MPDFELLPLDEAERNTQLLGKRGTPKRQYIGYIERLEDGHAGKLKGSEGETTAAIRRRLGGKVPGQGTGGPESRRPGVFLGGRQSRCS